MQVDFYILAAAAERERLRTACRLADKAWQQGHRVFIHADSRETARSIDDMLWTYRQDSFVPHAMYSQRQGINGQSVDEDALEPVLVGDGSTYPAEIDVLINLAETVPPFADKSRRVAEIVSADDPGRRTGRIRYRDYLDRGVSIQQHDL